MLVETTSLPIYIQEQIIAYQQSELLASKAKPLPQKGLIGGEQVFGIWANQSITVSPIKTKSVPNGNKIGKKMMWG